MQFWAWILTSWKVDAWKTGSWGQSTVLREIIILQSRINRTIEKDSNVY
jgi:hypothetical protein